MRSIVLSLLVFLPFSIISQTDTVVVGAISLQKLKNLSKWDSEFQAEYDMYKPNIEQILLLSNNIEQAKLFQIYLGTWCSDSREQVPRILKVLNEAKVSMEKIELIGLNKDKTEPSDAVRINKIEKVPTLFLETFDEYKIKIIEETPIISIENDLNNCFLSFSKGYIIPPKKTINQKENKQ